MQNTDPNAWAWAEDRSQDASALNLAGLTEESTGRILVSPLLEEHEQKAVVNHERLHLALSSGSAPSFRDLATRLKKEGEALTAENQSPITYEGGSIQDFIRRADMARVHEGEAASRFFMDALNPRMLINASGRYGCVPTNPIPVMTVYRENSYLEEVRTDDGQKVAFERLGSALSPVSRHVVDCYRICSLSNELLAHFFVAPYCSYTAVHAPGGFYREVGAADSDTRYAESVSQINDLAQSCMRVILDSLNDGRSERTNLATIEQMRDDIEFVGGEFSLHPEHAAQLKDLKTQEKLGISGWLTLLELRRALAEGNVKGVRKTLNALDAANKAVGPIWKVREPATYDATIKQLRSAVSLVRWFRTPWSKHGKQ
jgi:hypothetical protein